jgi:hypothetical protein
MVILESLVEINIIIEVVYFSLQVHIMLDVSLADKAYLNVTCHTMLIMFQPTMPELPFLTV